MSTSAGIIAGADTGERAGKQFCPNTSGGDNGDDKCRALIEQIKRHIEGMRKKWNDLAVDKDGLFEGNSGIGTWPGHLVRYEGLRIGLQNMVNTAILEGCPVPPEAYEMLARPAPLLPFK